MIKRDRLVKTFCDLVQIDSPSGEEEMVAVELKRRLEALGLAIVGDEYGNVIATDGGQDPLLLSAHMDTVEPGRGINPQVEGDLIVSDGTTIVAGDCKAGVAIILEALESIKEDGASRKSVEVAFTREEETGLLGAYNLDYSKLTAKEAFVFDNEGPASQITSTSPTCLGFEIQIKGRAAHAGIEPEKGLSAIRIAAEIITRLPQGRLDEETTFNIGTVKGGSVINAVPENALVTGEFRSRNLETFDSIRLQLSEAIGDVRIMFPEAAIEEHLDTLFETYTLTEEDPAMRRVIAALQSLRLKPTMRPSGGGTDGNVFRRRGISAVVMGMATQGMHTVREKVTIPDLLDGARICETLLKE